MSDNHLKPEGTIDILDQDGMVIIRMMGQELVIEPEMARQMGEAMAKAAYTAKFGVTPQTQTSAITADKRQMMITRVHHVIRSLSTQKRMTKHRMATEVVDTILAEI